MQELLYKDLGLVDYKETWDFQEQLLVSNVTKKQEGRLDETKHHLLLLEHPLVYTLGKSGKEEHVLISPEEREEKNIQYYKINRGGDITFHGPGQLVGYPILDLEKFYTILAVI